jgi:hypothetical protein
MGYKRVTPKTFTPLKVSYEKTSSSQATGYSLCTRMKLTLALFEVDL